jgi:stage II sporulation protein D
LARHGYIAAKIDDISIADLTPAGRAKKINIRTANSTKMIPAEVFREALGSTEIPSVFLEVELSEGEVVFSGRGNGHGVGLCQWGAKEMAEKGHGFRSILTHYYPGVTLKRIY